RSAVNWNMSMVARSARRSAGGVRCERGLPIMTMHIVPETGDDVSRQWEHQAIRCLVQESARSADTHLLKLKLPGFPHIDFYFKDESSHPSGSLKHRLARSL